MEAQRLYAQCCFALKSRAVRAGLLRPDSMPIAEACTLVDASLEHEACACTGRGAEARTYTPLPSRVVITLIAASFGDGLLHLGLASVELF